MPTQQIRGLSNFIADIRNCASKDLEWKRVQQENAKIRQRFTTKLLSEYERRKCVWKLVYIWMLGYEVSFGQVEALNLIGSQTYSGKSCGYIACSILLSDSDDEILNLSINLIKQDLSSSNEFYASLALNFLANTATPAMAEMLFREVLQLTANTTLPNLRRKAFLVLLRFVRLKPDTLASSVWANTAAKALHTETDLGCLLTTSAFILGIFELQPNCPSLLSLTPRILSILQRLVEGDAPPHAYYNGVAAPWLQLKLLRVLQYLPPPAANTESWIKVREMTTAILSRPMMNLSRPHQSEKRYRRKEELEKINKCHMEHAIFFETIDLLLSYDEVFPIQLKQNAVTTLTSMTSIKEGSIRYLRLEALARLCKDSAVAVPLQRQMSQIVAQMHENDDMIRKQALNVLFSMADQSTWKPIVEEFLKVLRTSEKHTQDDICLKVAILVEHFAPNVLSFIDTVFAVLESAPESVGEAVWQRAIQMLTDQAEEIQFRAARKAYDSLADSFAHETLVKLSAYVLGEYGHLLVDEAPALKQFAMLYKHFHRVSSPVRAILLLAFAKLLCVDDSVAEKVLRVLDESAQSADVEVQQRAVELAALHSKMEESEYDSVFAQMPAYSEAILKVSPLMRRAKMAVQTKAFTRIELEEAAATEGPLLKPSTRRVDPALSSGSSEEVAVDEGSGAESSGPEFASSGSSSSSSSSEKSSTSSESSEKRSPKARPMTRPVSASSQASLRELWQRTCMQGSGVLSDDGTILVRSRQQFRPPGGRVILEVMNKDPKGRQLQLLGLVIEPSPLLKCVVSGVPTAPLPPQGVFSFVVDVEAQQLFLTPPNFQLGAKFLQGDTVSVRTCLPTVLSSFVVPTPVPNAEAFKMQWAGSRQQLGETVTQELTRVGTANSLVSPTDYFNVLRTSFNFSVLRINQSLCGSGVLLLSSIATAPSCQSPLATARLFLARTMRVSLVSIPLLFDGVVGSFFSATQSEAEVSVGEASRDFSEGSSRSRKCLPVFKQLLTISTLPHVSKEESSRGILGSIFNIFGNAKSSTESPLEITVQQLNDKAARGQVLASALITQFDTLQALVAASQDSTIEGLSDASAEAVVALQAARKAPEDKLLQEKLKLALRSFARALSLDVSLGRALLPQTQLQKVEQLFGPIVEVSSSKRSGLTGREADLLVKEIEDLKTTAADLDDAQQVTANLEEVNRQAILLAKAKQSLLARLIRGKTAENDDSIVAAACDLAFVQRKLTGVTPDPLSSEKVPPGQQKSDLVSGQGFLWDTLFGSNSRPDGSSQMGSREEQAAEAERLKEEKLKKIKEEFDSVAIQELPTLQKSIMETQTMLVRFAQYTQSLVAVLCSEKVHSKASGSLVNLIDRIIKARNYQSGFYTQMARGVALTRQANWAASEALQLSDLCSQLIANVTLIFDGARV